MQIAGFGRKKRIEIDRNERLKPGPFVGYLFVDMLLKRTHQKRVSSAVVASRMT